MCVHVDSQKLEFIRGFGYFYCRTDSDSPHQTVYTTSSRGLGIDNMVIESDYILLILRLCKIVYLFTSEFLVGVDRQEQQPGRKFERGPGNEVLVTSGYTDYVNI